MLAAMGQIHLVRHGQASFDADDYDWEDALGLAPWPKDGDTIDVGIRKLEKIGARIARGRGDDRQGSLRLLAHRAGASYSVAFERSMADDRCAHVRKIVEPEVTKSRVPKRGHSLQPH